MPSISALLFGFTVIAEVYFGSSEASPHSTHKKTVVYVFGSEDISIIDPESKSILSRINPEGVCTWNPSTRTNCSVGGVVAVRNELIFFSDSAGNRVHVIDVKKQQVVETIPTDAYPYYLYHLHWLNEVWVHAWTLSTFDVINTGGKLNRTHKSIRAHVQPGFNHGYMFADHKVKEGNTAYVTHFRDPGLHQLDLKSKSYKDFVNVSHYGCTGTFYFAYSSINKHAFFDCRRKKGLLELDVSTDRVVRKWNFTGVPYASPDGRYIVSLYKDENRLTNELIASKVYVLVISGRDKPVIHEVDIPGGVSKLVFYEKTGTSGRYVAYISLVYSNKIAVLDFEFLESPNYADKVEYIEDVGSVLSGPGMHAVSRPLLVAGRWIVAPSTVDSSVAIIDTTSRKLHGIVPGVVGSKRMVAVDLQATVAAANRHPAQEILILAVLVAVCILVG